MKAAFESLKEAGGSPALRDVKVAVQRRVKLSPHDLELYPKTGYVRWESVLHFYSIDCVKAGFIRKHGGRWHLTPEGEGVLGLPAREILDRAIRAYREWKANRPDEFAVLEKSSPTDAAPETVVGQAGRSFVLERAESEARAEIEDFGRALGAYDFQELVGALLRGMGYSTPFIAPTGLTVVRIFSLIPIRLERRPLTFEFK